VLLARKPRDAAAVHCGLKFADIAKLRKPSFRAIDIYTVTGAKQNLT